MNTNFVFRIELYFTDHDFSNKVVTIMVVFMIFYVKNHDIENRTYQIYLSKLEL